MGGAIGRHRRWHGLWPLAVGLVTGWTLLFLALGSEAEQAAGDADPPEARLSVDARARAAAMRVETRGCGQMGGGTAVATTEGILTNRHVVEGASRLVVAGSSVIGRALAPGMDAALLESPAQWSAQALTLADELPVEGEMVTVAGYPAGGGLVVVTGSVLSHSDQSWWGEGSGPLLIVDVQVSPGWSGGPVLDGEGQLVGIVRGTETSTGVTLVEPSVALLEWMGSDPQVEAVSAAVARCEPG
ncbi:MAG: trypsin-like peptidase domain-containing protein [Actinomycetia bacterium]|nr:trypsin-like peptidase domain-containing protein [Actinomycetes bacterium]